MDELQSTFRNLTARPPSLDFSKKKFGYEETLSNYVKLRKSVKKGKT